MNILMAPDWRNGNPYQKLLSEQLSQLGVQVEFLQNYRRLLPLARGIAAHSARIFHLHWPDAYFSLRYDGLDRLREMRFELDLRLALRGRGLIATAHNLYPHNRGHRAMIRHNVRLYYRLAKRIIVHNRASIPLLQKHFQIDPTRCCLVPHGDISVAMPCLPSKEEARERLQISQDAKICLMFGVIEPYKGIETVVEYWNKAKPNIKLAIVGRPNTPAYEAVLRQKTEGGANVWYRPGWLSDAVLADWLAATDAVLFNYRAILVSGAVTLVRSFGIPVLLPQSLDTIELDEPFPSVFRFKDWDTDFSNQLTLAVMQDRDFEAARPWRTEHAWPNVAQKTLAIYRQALEEL